MRINIYAEELPDGIGPDSIERVTKQADTGRTFYGARVYLASPDELHHTLADDDRSAVTFWGPRAAVASMLRAMADAMDAPI